MLFAAVFLITLAAIHTTPVFNSDPVLSDDAFPFVVRLDIREKIRHNGKIVISPAHCTGFLVTMGVVVTAAHCFDDEYGKPTVEVSAGAVDLVTEGVKKIKMLDYKKHKDYVEGDDNSAEKHMKNDIAVVWLEKKFDRSSKITPATLDCYDDDYTDEIGTVVGWGDTGEVEDTTTLRKGRMKVVSAANCKTFGKQSPEYNTFCAVVGARNQYPGPGDSGGPFVVDNAVVGINSWQPIFTNKHLPKVVVFVKIQKYVNFILHNVRNGPPNGRKHITGENEVSNNCKSDKSRPGSSSSSKTNQPRSGSPSGSKVIRPSSSGGSGGSRSSTLT